MCRHGVKRSECAFCTLFPFHRQMNPCIVYLASPREFAYGIFKRIDVLHRSISIVKKALDLDILVFHEDYTEEDMRRFPAGIQWNKIEFGGQEHRHTYMRSRYGYLMMCRFFSGVLQSHPALEPYSHYMRMDDDSFLMHPLLTREKVMSLCAYDYVYRTIFAEEGHPQQPLHTFTKEFLQRKGMNANTLAVGLAPYNNFHISSLAMWRHPIVKEYIQAIEDANGFLGQGFFDANIHAQIIWVMDLGIKVYGDFTFGYRHNHHISRLGTRHLDFIETTPFMPVSDEVETTNTTLP